MSIIKSILGNRVLHHVLFWVGLFLLNAYSQFFPFPISNFYKGGVNLIYGLDIQDLGFMSVSYRVIPSFLCITFLCIIHTQVLMPFLLERRRYLKYFFGLVFCFVIFPRLEFFFAEKFISPVYDFKKETNFYLLVPSQKDDIFIMNRIDESIWDKLREKKNPEERMNLFSQMQNNVYQTLEIKNYNGIKTPEEGMVALGKYFVERSKDKSRWIDTNDPTQLNHFNQIPLSLDNWWFIYLRFSFFFLLTTGIKFSRNWFQNSILFETQAQQKATELALLQNQVNPHFLFNTLNNIQSLARLKSDKTETTIIKLSELMRYMLKEGKNGKVLLSKEVKFIESYIELEQLRLGNRAEIVFRKEINPHTTEVPPLIFISFIENAFKHGVNSLTEGAQITILLTEPMEEKHKGKAICFQIVNNYDPSASTSGSGQGLENVKRRLELLYPNGKHRLDIVKTTDRFDVSLKIFLV